MQRHGGVVVTRGIRRVVAVPQTGVPRVAVAEHRLQHVPIGRIAIQTYSNAGEGLRDLTNGLTLSGDSHDVRLTASALRTESSGNPGNGRCQVAVAGQLDVVGKVVVAIGQVNSVVDKLRHDTRQQVVTHI